MKSIKNQLSLKYSDMLSIDYSSLLQVFILFLFMALVRYLFFAGSAYIICYKPGLKGLKRFKIQPFPPKKKQLRNELLFSLSTMVVFSSVALVIYLLYINRLTTIYIEPDEHGWLYFFGSIIIMIILHDMYFYFSHRLLHTKWWLRHVHVVHHRSHNPTPLAAYSFHPLEAILQTLFVFPFVTIFPINLYAFLLFTLFIVLLNVFGHMGFEFIPQKIRSSKTGQLFTSSTHHNLHHQKVNKNFGYYFTWCDKLFKTLHKDSFR